VSGVTYSRDEWLRVSLGDVCEFAYGKSLPAKSRSGAGFAVFGSHGEVGRHETATTSGPTIIVGRKGSFGEIHYSQEACSPIDTTYYITAKQTDCYLPWLTRILRTLGLNKLNRAAAIPGLNREDAYRQRLLLPPLPEQKRIARILDAADALRAKRRESIAQLDALVQATFLEMFSRYEPKRSVQSLLDSGQLSLHKDGNHGSKYPRAKEFVPHGVPFISAKCLEDDGSWSESKLQYLSTERANDMTIGWIEGGDVLLAHNASVGKTGLYRGEFGKALIGTSLTCFRPDNTQLRSEYLFAALRSGDFQQQLFSNMGQTTRNQVPITAQRRLTIPVPPVSDQQVFAERMLAIDEQAQRLSCQSLQLDALFASLQSRAFAGEL